MLVYYDMPRKSIPLENFIDRLDEVNRLIILAREKERRDPIASSKDINALCRGAVVLLCSHLEAYIKELGEIALDSLSKNAIGKSALAPQFFYYLSQEKIELIKNANDPSKVSEKIHEFLLAEAIYWTKEIPFSDPLPVDSFNRGFSNPAYKKIKKYFNRFGYSEFDSDLNKKLKARKIFLTNTVEQLVDTRNKIAHGDPLATKTPGEVTQMVATVRSFCNATDDLFAIWWRKKFCKLR